MGSHGTGGLCFKRGANSFANYWGNWVNVRHKTQVIAAILMARIIATTAHSSQNINGNDSHL